MLMLDAPPLLSLRRPACEALQLTLVGCGGTGSHLATGLASLAMTLADRDVPVRLRFIDPDRVEAKNVGRQLFARGDIGQPKAEVLASRLNAAYGLAIAATVRPVTPQDVEPASDYSNWHVVIGAVDNPAARRVIATPLTWYDEHRNLRRWWLDCGNENASGQVLLGNCHEAYQLKGAVSPLGLVDRLPAPGLVAPDLLATPAPVKRKAASCAELTAAGEQGLMVNRMMAAWALAMLHDLLLGELKYFGVWLNLATGGVRTWSIDLPTLSEASGLSPAELQGEKK